MPVAPVDQQPSSEKALTTQVAAQLQEIIPAVETSDIGSLLLEEYFDLYIAKKVEGYRDDFGEEVSDEAAGERWRKTSKNNMEVGKRLWVFLLRNRPLLQFLDAEIREARKEMRRLPETQSGLSSRPCEFLSSDQNLLDRQIMIQLTNSYDTYRQVLPYGELARHGDGTGNPSGPFLQLAFG